MSYLFIDRCREGFHSTSDLIRSGTSGTCAILVVAPHPDDEVLGCGGVMARHAAAGDEVRVLVITRGVADLYSPELVESVREEMRQAHAKLGVSGAPVSRFPGAANGYRAAAHGVRCHRSRAWRVSPAYHVHSAPWRYALRARPHLSMLPRGRTRPLDRSAPRRLLAYETLSETEWGPPLPSMAFQPTVYIDIEKQLPQKLAAAACFKSQIKPMPHPRSLDAIKALAQFRGATANLQAAEAFMLVREIAD